jgi:hypothetical protein
MTKVTKMTDKKKPAAVFVFQGGDGMEKKAGLTLDLAQAIPNISSLIGDSEQKVEYKYRHDVTPKALSTYLRSVSARIKSMPYDGLTELTPEDWNLVFWLAYRLGDTEFYEDTSQFPEMMEIADLILQMPEPARLFYFGTYLGECFAYECDCDRNRVKLLRKEAKQWLESLSQASQHRYQNTPIPGIYRKYKKESTHTYDLDEKYKDQWLIDNQEDLDAGRIFNWYELDMETKVHLVHLNIKLYACTCERPFYEMWNGFCSTLPRIADFLWSNMKRDELMKYTKTSDSKKDGVAKRKDTFEDLLAYVEFARDR